MIFLIPASLATMVYLAAWLKLNFELRASLSAIRLSLFSPMLFLVSMLAFHRRMPREVLLVVDYSILLLSIYTICWGALASITDLSSLILRKPRQGGKAVAFGIIAVSMLPALNLTFRLEQGYHPSSRHVSRAVERDIAPAKMVRPFSSCGDIFAPDCKIYASQMLAGAAILKAPAKQPGRLYIGKYRATYSAKVRLESICRVDLSDWKVEMLDGPSAKPIFSPDESSMVYDKYTGTEDAFYGNGPVPRVGIWVMGADGGNKRPLTTDGRTKALRWLNDHEILAAKVEFGWGDDEDLSDWNPWNKTGYVRINCVDGTATIMPSEPLEDNPVREVTTEFIAGTQKYSGRYDFLYGTATVFSTPYVCTYSEWIWKPEVLWLGKDQFLTVAFSPYPGKEVPYARDDGDFNLVRVNVKTQKHEILRERIDCCPNMTMSPNGELLFLKLPGDRLLVANTDFTKSREINRDPGMTGNFSSSSWSADSQFLFLEFYYPEAIYQVGVI